MSYPRAFPPQASARFTQFRWRHRHRLGLRCEGLENRQLLSTLASQAPDPSQITAQPSLQVLPLVTPGPTGLSPQQISNAYGVNQIKFSNGTITGNGAGQTIAIVTAYNDPNISSDLAAFDAQYRLSAPGSLTVRNLGGSTTDAGWALETSLDVEWAHALAPAANILLVEGRSSSLTDLFNAVSYASKQQGVSVVSMSWGTTEFWGQWGYDSLFTTPAGHSGVTYVAASGDSGAWNGPMYPSSSPNVLAVGGTTLTLSGSNYGSESGWSGSTGGFSGYDSYWQFYEPAGSYQVAAQTASGLNYGVRTTPDVSFNADPNSGVAVYDSIPYSGQSGWFQVGGTSAATPSWAGLIAIANQGLATGSKGPLSGTQALSQLYALPSSDFHDITSGFNGYSATTGYDLVTGLGSPKANQVVAGILAAYGVSEGPSSSQVVATTTSKTSSTAGSHFELIITTSGSTGSSSGSSGALGSTGAGSGTSVVTVSPPTTTSQNNAATQLQAQLPLTASTQAQTPAAHVANSTVSQSTTATSVSNAAPAQGLLQSVGSTARIPGEDFQPESDWLPETEAPVKPGPQVQSQPAAEQAPASDPAPPTQPPATDPAPPVEPDQPMEEDPLAPFDRALDQVSLSRLAGRVELPLEGVTDQSRASEQRSGISLSALAGTALLATGGYRLLIGRSDRIRRRWSPVRFFV
jgi:subtilase family serine protease